MNLKTAWNLSQTSDLKKWCHPRNPRLHALWWAVVYRDWEVESLFPALKLGPSFWLPRPVEITWVTSKFRHPQAIKANINLNLTLYPKNELWMDHELKWNMWIYKTLKKKTIGENLDLELDRVYRLDTETWLIRGKFKKLDPRKILNFALWKMLWRRWKDKLLTGKNAYKPHIQQRI